MNGLIYEIRIFACELLLNLIVRIAPKKGDGRILIKAILDYTESLDLGGLEKVVGDE